MVWVIPVVTIVIVVLYMLSSVKILAEDERAVIFRLGRILPELKGPGIVLVLPPMDRMVRVDIRQIGSDATPEGIITAISASDPKKLLRHGG